MTVWPAVQANFQLQTPRLRLRCPRDEDAPQIADLAGDKDVAEMTATIPYPYPEGVAKAFTAKARESALLGHDLTLMITLGDDDAIIVGLVSAKPGPSDRASIAYWIGRRYRGRGIATEAVNAMLASIFSQTAINEVITNVRVTNSASARVLEKCGFYRIGLGEQSFPGRGQVLPVEQFRIERGQHLAGR
jgi:RimJ/RimL family protein N-acetyltransferase